MIFPVLISGMVFTGCSSDKEEPTANLQHIHTELGGCNTNIALRSAVSETEEDAINITVSKDKIHVFVGLNYICKTVPFETRVEIVDDVMFMYLKDIGGDYERCECYYTFDFVFQWQGTLNQKYKIVLVDPREENHVIISEGTIVENE
jgi:hypothetical protein